MTPWCSSGVGPTRLLVGGSPSGKVWLRRLDDQDPDSAREIEAAAFLWRDQVTHIRGEQLVAPGSDAYNITRRCLLDILGSRATDLGVRVEYEREIASRAELPEADVIIAADGVNSRIRQEAGDFPTR